MSYVRDFFKNLARSEKSAGHKLRLITRNRARAMVRGCCGNYGEPGC